MMPKPLLPISIGGKKAQADYSKLMALRHQAVENCKKHWERDDPSWSEVYKVVANIEDLFNGTH
jgi:hypothetical protein